MTYAGGQAEYVGVPKANVGPLLIPQGLADERVLFLSDILPTGYQAAINGKVGPGSTVAVFRAGPVGLMAVAVAGCSVLKRSSLLIITSTAWTLHG